VIALAPGGHRLASGTVIVLASGTVIVLAPAR
jgi:hypothetical protein